MPAQARALLFINLIFGRATCEDASGSPNGWEAIFKEVSMKSLIVAASALILSGGVACAATTGSTAPANGQSQANAQTNPGPATKVRQELEQNLAKAGFTDIKIMPESFLIRAKDKDGNPMMMVVNPDSMTAVEAIGANNSNSKSNSASNNSNSDNAAGSAPSPSAK
jgi:hypothetical protein